MRRENLKMVALGVALLLSSPALSAPALSSPAVAKPLDLTDPDDLIRVMRKIHCSTEDNHPIFFSWAGEGYSRRAGEADRKLFRVVGMNVRQCVTLDGGARGQGYRMVSREIMLYLDPATGEILRHWHNPWTGEDVTVLHVANDPVNGRPTFPSDPEGNAYLAWNGRVQGNDWTMTITIPLFYHNVLQGDYQPYVGGASHATEMFNFTGKLGDLTDPGRHTALDVKVGWVRIAQWLPWMAMQGRDGLMYFHAASRKISGFEALPQILQDYINNEAPEYRAPPPGDDQRPNETSWSVVMKTVEGGRLPRGGAN